MKILIVDDRKEERYLLEILLKGNGYQVVSAINGKEALEKLHVDGFDMIISDVLMPVMDGFRFCSEVRADDSLKDIPFIFYTATYKDEKDERLSTKVGADKYIIKPIEPDEFIKIIKGVIKDVKKQKIKRKRPVLEEEKEVFKLYSERLVRKLEKKMLELEREVSTRRRAEERINHLNRVILAVRNVNQLITREKDRDRLLKGACEALVEGRGYYNAWIVLLEKTGELVTTAEAGLGKEFLPMLERLERGELPDCARQAVSQSEVVVIDDPSSTCVDCPLAPSYAGGRGLVVRLGHGEKVYGMLILSISGAYTMVEEEQELGKGVAEDIAFALYAIELGKERKRAEETLRESEEKHRLLVNNATDAIFVAQDEVIKFPNPRTEELVGYSAEELATIRFTDLIHPEDTDKVRDRYRRRLKGESLPTTYSFRIINRAGEELWTQLNTVVITWGGRPATLNFLRDITPQRKLEAQLQQSQKMEAIGILAGGVAHDFNNILTTIIGNASLALMNVSKDDTLREEIEEIKIAGERAASLTRQLLAFSRKQIIHPKILDLNELLTDIEKMLGRLIGEDIELLTIPGPALWQVEADPGQMEQVIMNLAINARDAMPKGGKLTVETANVDLDRNYFRKHGIEKEQPGTYVMLAVSDTGIGMDKETQEHIFEPFFTTKEIGKGTGLGLSTVYGIVKQNNGFIWVYSEPGQGSTFKIYLPKAKGDVEEEEKERTSVSELGGSETVLIVEDDDSLRKLAQRTLQQHGYRVLEAENGEDALRISKEHEGPIDLLITDVVMPKMGGKEVAERLQPLYPQMKVIYMSGYTDDAIVQHGVLGPGLNFLEKPFTPEGLARKVREILNTE